MTTIAVTTTHIAADGLQVWNHEIRSRAHRKIRVANSVNGQTIFALTGNAPYFGPIIEWHQSGADPTKAPKCSDDETWTILVIDHSGMWKMSCLSPHPEQFFAPLGLGRGGEMATGAMLAGAGAEEAVRLVAGQTNHTGGAIQVVNIADALGRAPPLVEAAE